MSTRHDMTEQEMRAMKVWERRVLRPAAAKTGLLELCIEMQAAYRRLLDALESVPEEKMDVPLAEERMTAAELLAHLAVVMGWQAKKLQEIGTGEVTREDAFSDLFAGTQGRSLLALRAAFDTAWKALERAVSAYGEAVGASTHPWFGALNTREWIASVSAHFDYHRAQIEARFPNGRSERA